MAVRDESVRLSLIDDFTTPMAKAAAATALLDRALHDLDGSAVSARSSTADLSKNDGLPALDRNARKADQSINQLTGRLRLAADLTASLGTALVPVAAAGAGGLAGLASQAGAAAGAAGVAILAFSGMGDGLKALNQYQLEPTQANLEKVNEEFRKAGPAGRQFLLYLDSIEPQLKSLQQAARAGLLPGVQVGLDELLTALPQVRGYIRDVAETLGTLSADAGADLVGEQWELFFDFVRSDGIVLLDQLARSAGNLGQGLGNMLAGFSPASRDFSDGLLELTERFADWSTTLDENASFQEFVDYVRQSGPQVVEFLGATATALGDLAEAAGPLGPVTLPVLTGVVELLSGIADSDLGTPILATASALSALNLATRGLGKLGSANLIQTNYVKPIRDLRAAAPSVGQVGTYFYRMGQSAELASSKTLAARGAVRGFTRELGGLGRGAALMGGLAVAGTGVADSMGLSNTMSLALMGTIAGPWGAAVGGATGLALDFAAANDSLEEAARNLDDALREGSREGITQYRDQLEGMIEDNERARGAFSPLNPFDPIAMIEDPLRNVKAIRAGLLEQFGVIDKYRTKVQEANDELAGQQGLRTLLGVPSGLAREFDVASQSVDEFGASFTALNQLLDRSGSLVNYERALDDLSASMKESGSFNVGIEKGRKNIEGLNNVVARAIERSEALKEAGDNLGAVRILRRASSDLEEFGRKNAGAKKQIEPLVAELDRLSTKRVEPKIDADNKPLKDKVSKSDRELARIQARVARAVITGDNAAALRAISQVKGGLDGLRDRTVRVRVVREGSGFGPQSATGYATGGYTGPGHRLEPRGVVHAGEVVIPQDLVRRDWSMLTSRYGHLPGFADGGVVGNTSGRSGDSRRRDQAFDITFDVDRLRNDLRNLGRGLRESERVLDRETQKRDRLQAMFDEVAGNARSTVRSDIFAPSENVWSGGQQSPNDRLRADINNSREFITIIKSLKLKGLDGPAFAELIATQDLDKARFYASLPAADLMTYENLYNQRDRLNAQVATAAGDAAFGAPLAAANAQVKALETVVKAQEKAIKLQTKTLETAIDRNAKTVVGGVGGSASTGKKNQRRDGRRS